LVNPATFTSKGHDLFATLHGRLNVDNDRAAKSGWTPRASLPESRCCSAQISTAVAPSDTTSLGRTSSILRIARLFANKRDGCSHRSFTEHGPSSAWHQRL
jgi:hypothetical protein